MGMLVAAHLDFLAVSDNENDRAANTVVANAP